MSAVKFRQILFCKAPIPGRAKTRLAPLLGLHGAARAYKDILTKLVHAFSPADVVLYVETSDDASLMQSLFPAYSIRQQRGIDLGARMAAALADERATAPGAVLLAGTDVPDYSPAMAHRAAQALEHHEVVFGPAADGGYYMVGIARMVDPARIPALFEEIPWSTERTWAVQQARARQLGFQPFELEPLVDVDRPRDLAAVAARCGLSFPDIRVVIPVLNEEKTLGGVLADLQSAGVFKEVVCADNGSTDQSHNVAEKAGARVTHCRERGYGATCLEALRDIRERGGCDVVLFLDADGSDDPDAFLPVLEPVVSGRADFSLGSRTPSLSEPGAVPAHARFGNRFACALMRLLVGGTYTDLGPLRAIRWSALERLQMNDRNFGWTIQMQMRALRHGLEIVEVPVGARTRRGGESKVSATIEGSIRAGTLILKTVLWEMCMGATDKDKKEGDAAKSNAEKDKKPVDLSAIEIDIHEETVKDKKKA